MATGICMDASAEGGQHHSKAICTALDILLGCIISSAVVGEAM
jgi:hypothetical protein